jgi:hypothetical protein
MTQSLNLSPNLTAADHFYEALIEAHRTLSESESAAFNARLILVLANHIGHIDVLREALLAASVASLHADTANEPTAG